MRAELPATLEILDCINKEGEEIDSDGEASEPEDEDDDDGSDNSEEAEDANEEAAADGDDTVKADPSKAKEEKVEDNDETAETQLKRQKTSQEAWISFKTLKWRIEGFNKIQLRNYKSYLNKCNLHDPYPLNFPIGAT